MIYLKIFAISTNFLFISFTCFFTAEVQIFFDIIVSEGKITLQSFKPRGLSIYWNLFDTEVIKYRGINLWQKLWGFQIRVIKGEEKANLIPWNFYQRPVFAH